MTCLEQGRRGPTRAIFTVPHFQHLKGAIGCLLLQGDPNEPFPPTQPPERPGFFHQPAGAHALVEKDLVAVSEQRQKNRDLE